MSHDKVTFYLQTADRTRKAQITLPRAMYVSDIIKASSGRWFLSRNMDYTVCNLTRNLQLLAGDSLSEDKVRNGDTLMLQPLALHGAL